MSDHLRPHDAALERLKRLHPKSIDLSLGRMRRLLADLGDPQARLAPVVHVAGTNAKGSTLAYLRAMAEAAGRTAHVFTSPHLVRFAERIRLGARPAGRLIEDAALSRLLDRVEAANAGAPITFFEITAAAAFCAFAEAPADLCLLETGLGGRLDATNVVERPALCVLTPIDLDHQEFLGPSLAAIAGEKAGIFKPGVPIVSAPQPAEALAVIEARARDLGCRLILMGRDAAFAIRDGRLSVSLDGRSLGLAAPALHGAHQAANAALAAVAALSLDPALGVTVDAVAAGPGRAEWPARMQPLTAGPLGAAAAARGAQLWLDGGHNPHAARALAQTLAQMATDGRPCVLVCGMLANKDAEGFFGAFSALAPRVAATGFEAPSARPPAQLAAAARAAGFEAEAYADVTGAVEAVLARPGPAPRVLICGSLYLAGEVLGLSPDTWPS